MRLERARKNPAIVALPIVLLLWVLPFHSLVLAFFFGVVRISPRATTILAAWKEMVALALLGLVIGRAILSRGPRTRICAPDVAVTGLIALGLLFILTEDAIFAANIPHKVELFGFRSSIFFMFMYFVGRGSPEVGDHSVYVKNAFRVAVMVAAFGILERIFVGPDMIVALGAASYMNDFLGLGATTVGNDWGLPASYWSVLGGHAVRRAGSVFLGGQSFALPFLFLMPAATAWVFDPSKRPRFWSIVGYLIVWTGLLLTITRMTVIACVIQVVIYFLITRRPARVVVAGITMAGIFAVTLFIVPGLRAFVWETLTFQTASSYSHLSDWTRGVVAFADQPWGHGFGSSDQVATRFGRVALTADNMFLGYAVDLGVVGLLGHLAVLFTIALSAWRLFARSIGPEERMLACTVLLTTIGIAFNNGSAATFTSVFLAYNFFLLAGAAVTRYQRLHQAAPVRVPAPIGVPAPAAVPS